MKTYRLETQLWLSPPRRRLFEFFAEPRNLERITPPWLHFEITTPLTPLIEPGTLLDYRLRVRGIPLRWQSEIIVWEPPSRFVDRQTKGPYSRWVHEHTFTERDGGTLAGDNVEYAVPGGRIVQKLLVAPELERIFKYRHKMLEALFNPQDYWQQGKGGAALLKEDQS
jgi:ligand-binding SRPBCC domain-containing protein